MSAPRPFFLIYHHSSFCLLSPAFYLSKIWQTPFLSYKYDLVEYIESLSDHCCVMLELRSVCIRPFCFVYPSRAVDPDSHGSAFIFPPGSGSALRKTDGSGSANMNADPQPCFRLKILPAAFIIVVFFFFLSKKLLHPALCLIYASLPICRCLSLSLSLSLSLCLSVAICLSSLSLGTVHY